jgi:hypothetical protein
MQAPRRRWWRERAHRLRVDPETAELRRTRYGQLVADWVEVFPPVGMAPILSPKVPDIEG